MMTNFMAKDHPLIFIFLTLNAGNFFVSQIQGTHERNVEFCDINDGLSRSRLFKRVTAW